VLIGAVGGGAVAVVAACGSSGSGAGATPGAAGSTPPATTVAVRQTSLGTILTDSRGFTLYAFEGDRGTTSECSGACATTWPPVTTTNANVAVTGGASKSLVGETTRPGGAHQLTYAGHPLYLFQGDHSAGSTNGQGLVAFGARWDVLTPAGMEVTPAAASPSVAPQAPASPSVAPQAPASPSVAPQAPAANPIPQGNGGDHDGDNNGAPSDGDGNV
jgi:predicted lipoprotein with Yx(FWY)xxD motif